MSQINAILLVGNFSEEVGDSIFLETALVFPLFCPVDLIFPGAAKLLEALCISCFSPPILVILINALPASEALTAIL